jgi:hypothetical protein
LPNNPTPPVLLKRSNITVSLITVLLRLYDTGYPAVLGP